MMFLLSIASILRDIWEFICILFENLGNFWANLCDFIVALPHYLGFIYVAYAYLPTAFLGFAAAYLSAKVLLRLINYE